MSNLITAAHAVMWIFVAMAVITAVAYGIVRVQMWRETSEPVATFVRKLDRLEGVVGDARLYHLDPPTADGHEFVLVSATSFMGTEETYIFPAMSNGEVTDWLELEGSFRGGRDHSRALSGAGYTIA